MFSIFTHSTIHSGLSPISVGPSWTVTRPSLGSDLDLRYNLHETASSDHTEAARRADHTGLDAKGLGLSSETLPETNEGSWEIWGTFELGGPKRSLHLSSSTSRNLAKSSGSIVKTLPSPTLCLRPLSLPCPLSPQPRKGPGLHRSPTNPREARHRDSNPRCKVHTTPPTDPMVRVSHAVFGTRHKQPS